MRWREQPLLLLGHGIRAAGCADLAPMLLNLGVPVAASWLAKDLVDNSHPAFLGCTGIYGNPAANKALLEADQIVALGNRLCIWNLGTKDLPKNPEILAVDVDPSGARRLGGTVFNDDISYVIRQVLSPAPNAWWLSHCMTWKKEEPEGWGEQLNSYTFTANLQNHFLPNEVIVTDMGSPLISAFRVLSLKPPQRLLTSGGLGEMGCALPAAIGACFAGAERVTCLHADGGMMLNLQELQTIIHHKLPIKIIIYDNKGYLMIKHTQRTSEMPRSGVDAGSGVSFPDYRRLAQDFGFPAADIYTWEDFHRAIPQLYATQEPALVVFHMDPEQPLPKTL